MIFFYNYIFKAGLCSIFSNKNKRNFIRHSALKQSSGLIYITLLVTGSSTHKITSKFIFIAKNVAYTDLYSQIFKQLLKHVLFKTGLV